MVITYNIKNSLYLNITNHCTNRCDFCIRDHGTGLYASLKLEREPALDEILGDVLSQNLHKYKEIVFCGYGEPTCRLYDLLAICKKLREVTDTPIRLNTNGHASLISGEDTAPMFKGLIDVVSISMNAADPDTYYQLCHPKFGEDTYVGVLKFAREISKYVPKVVLTAVESTIQTDDVDRCRRIAADLGAEFRLREYI
ncbi:MAG: TatD family nuclease-associated radical SAM protein [Eubacteriales bacterium]|nr:TatD family nuclease-associated radical SAM protein [Eubacteriales bacterium]MDY3940430.1 TatD family nuclease-associated radical SAM protein [Eubacteriales bacterium]